jgi:uncharacterized protein YjiK
MLNSRQYKYFSLLLLLSFSFCQAQEKGAMYNFDKNNARQTKLSHKLKEISGIAFSQNGKLFAHDDERAVIYQIDPVDGRIIKSFYFGLIVKRADFEDIAIVKDSFFLISSDGIIYRFKEGNGNERVGFDTFSTGLNSANNVEGLCFDPATNSLLLALKGKPGSGLGKKKKAVYSFSLSTYKLDKEPRFILDKKGIADFSKENDFAPSGIARNPQTGNFFIISAVGNVIIELDPKGEIIHMDHLNHKMHNQPEGIDFSKNNSLFISDEGKKHGTLTEYLPGKK